jgi:hypothetical protein
MHRRRLTSGVILGLVASLSFCSPPGSGSRADADADADSDGDGDADGDGPRVFACNPGEQGCWENASYICGADGRTRENEIPCAQACSPALGCVFCDPGSRRCEGSVSMLCASGADRWLFGRDCAEWGSECIEATGFCADACAEAETGDSYVGCEYWPVALANTTALDSGVFDFRVAVANPNAGQATVRVFRGRSEVAAVTVEPGGLSEIVLPWVEGQSFGLGGDSWRSISVQDGAYRLISDLPVTVSQFNPFEYSAGGIFSYTNDATLLLPTHVLTGDYVGVSYLPFSRREGVVGQPMTAGSDRSPAYIAVVGVDPEPTQVRLEPAGLVAGAADGSFGDAGPGSAISFTLERGQVVHVASAPHPECVEGRPGYNRQEECSGIGPFRICDYLDTCAEREFDLSGSRLVADRPVAVFGGHVCAYVPYTSEACDHLEVQLPPIQTWGKDYVSTPMVDAGTSFENLVRVVAAFDGTEVVVDPPQGGVAGSTLSAGQFLEFFVQGPFHVTGTEAIMVAQFLLGQYYPEPDAQRGDPALTVLVPQEQYRADYTFITPTSYRPDTNGQSYILIVRQPGLDLSLDRGPATATWMPIAGREVGIVAVAGGTHTITSTMPFGMIAYGLGSFTSYAYPAGLNLEQITVIY